MASSSILFVTILLLIIVLDLSLGYVSPEIRRRWKHGFSFDEAVEIIEACAENGERKLEENQKELFCAVKYLDRFASSIHYKNDSAKKILLDATQGSWELRLALNSDKDQEFYPHPEFRSYAMAFITVDDEYFGKGIASNPSFCIVALGGPSSQNYKTRQVFMEYEDFYINGRSVPGWDLSYFMVSNNKKSMSTEESASTRVTDVCTTSPEKEGISKKLGRSGTEATASVIHCHYCYG
jgi:hypothetical protein